jgi:hypothetical protein
MKYHHDKDRSLYFTMPEKPKSRVSMFIEESIEEYDIDQLVLQLNNLKQKGFDQITYCEDCIILHKDKTKEEIQAEEKKYNEKLKEWEDEYFNKMQILDEAYKKKIELDSIMMRFK